MTDLDRAVPPHLRQAIHEHLRRSDRRPNGEASALFGRLFWTDRATWMAGSAYLAVLEARGNHKVASKVAREVRQCWELAMGPKDARLARAEERDPIDDAPTEVEPCL